MIMKKTALLFFLLLPVSVSLQAAPDGTQQGSYYTGTYRNVFTQIGVTESETDVRLQSLWETYFEGDKDQQRLYYEYGDDEAYIKDINNNDVRSEGMSYGMMICVQLDKQKEFNKLWKWVKTRMQLTTGDYKGFIGWNIKEDGTGLSTQTAPDGDEYVIMSLMFAAARWGSTPGDTLYDYWQEANDLLENSISKHALTNSSTTNIFNEDEYQVVFVPYASSAKHTDPSYHLPAFYQLWSLWANRNRMVWAQLADKSREMFPKFANADTGLMPDYATFAGVATGSSHKDFRYDAWRCCMNMALDYTWFAADDTEVKLVDLLLNFFNTQGITTHGSEYSLVGKCLNTDHSTGLIACNAMGASISKQSYADGFIKEFWGKELPTGKYRYYDGMLYFLNFLKLSGHYRIYKPAEVLDTALDQRHAYTEDGFMVVNDFDNVFNSNYDMQRTSSSKAVCKVVADTLAAANHVLNITPSNYDEFAVLRVNLPEGKTLATDYSQLDFDIYYNPAGDNAKQTLKVCFGTTKNLIYSESTGDKSTHGVWHHVSVSDLSGVSVGNPFKLYIGVRTRNANFCIDNLQLKPKYEVTSIVETTDGPTLSADYSQQTLRFNRTVQRADIYNVNGQWVQSASDVDRIALADLPGGMYFVKVSYPGQSQTFKVLK